MPDRELQSKLRSGVIWDMDGVLVYSNEFHYQAWKETYGRFGDDDRPLTRSSFSALFGMRNDLAIERMFGSEKATAAFIAQVSEEKERAFRRRIKGRLRPLPGVWSWLAYFQDRGIPQAVASSAPEENIRAILDAIEGWPFFVLVLSGEASASLASKPAPDIFLEAARRLRLPPASCLVIEDSVVGVQAAKTAGMPCLAITTTNSAEKLAAADMVIGDFSAVDPRTVLEALFSPGGAGAG